MRVTIARITGACVTEYLDNGETRAYVEWVDTRGQKGTTTGLASGTHMQALLARANREGVKVVHNKAGWLPEHTPNGTVEDEQEDQILNHEMTPELHASIDRVLNQAGYTTTAIYAISMWLAENGDDDGAELVKIFAFRFAKHEASII